MNAPATPPGRWDNLARSRAERLARAASFATGRMVSADHIVPLLEAIIEPGDRVCIEGNNQKQADFLARSLVKTDPSRLR
ncbi:MAG: malonate decarboxylase subunit alpha, partial [Sulfuricella sp.]